MRVALLPSIIFKEDILMNKKLEFKDIEALRDCEELKNMCRYEFRKVRLGGEEVYACTTNQQYEDIIWGGAEGILEQLDAHFGSSVADVDFASEIRDFILGRLESRYKMKLVDVFEEY
jgi:hypothetical protein